MKVNIYEISTCKIKILIYYDLIEKNNNFRQKKSITQINEIILAFVKTSIVKK